MESTNGVGDQWSVNMTYCNQVRGFLRLTAASSGAIKAVVLSPSHHPVTHLHRLVSVLGAEIYSGGQRMNGCTVGLGMGGRNSGRCWDCCEYRLTCRELVARMHSAE